MPRSAFHDFPIDAFPIVLIWFTEKMTILGSQAVTRPGALNVPGADTWGEPVGIQVVFGDGVMTVTPPPPRELWERARKTQDDGRSLIDEYNERQCNRPAPITGVPCWRQRGHEMPCEVKYFVRSEDDEVGVQTARWNSDARTELGR